MKYLVVIPTNVLYPESFSAPNAWLYANHVHKVRGVYEWELTPELILEHDAFIVELNWFLQLAGFTRVVGAIREHQPKAKILFGGLYSALKYRELFQKLPVDYYIKGDNELPLQMFLDEEPIEKIPNLAGRDFENEQTYFFSLSDFENIDYNLDWFPTGLKERERLLSSPMDEMYSNHAPQYPLPMIFSTKGGCLSKHAGCDYCLGGKYSKLREIYGRRILTIDNDLAIRLFKKIEKKFSAATFFVLSAPNYDFSGEYFDIDIHIEFDSPTTPEQAEKIISAFRSSRSHVAVFKDGITGSSKRVDMGEFLDLESDRHKMYFFGDTSHHDIPDDHLLYVDNVLPEWTDYNVYMNYDSAMKISEFLKPDPRLLDKPLLRAQLSEMFMKHTDPILNDMARESLRADS